MDRIPEGGCPLYVKDSYYVEMRREDRAGDSTNLMRWTFVALELPMPRGISTSAEEEPNNERGI